MLSTSQKQPIVGACFHILSYIRPSHRPVARGGGSGGSADPPLENQRSTFWNLAREIIKANNYKWLTIYLHQLLCTKPPTKWLQNLLSKGGSGGANL